MATNDASLIRVGWRVRESPLEPAAVAATGDAASGLARRLLELSDEDLRRLRGVGGPDLIVVLGAAEALPWSPGVRYLGAVEGKHPLYLPTTYEPDVPLELFEAAVKRQFPTAHYPLAILPDPGIVASTSESRPMCRETLRRWIDGVWL